MRKGTKHTQKTLDRLRVAYKEKRDGGVIFGFQTGVTLPKESIEKMRKSRQGQPCHNAGALSNLWKGGITPIMQLIRTSVRYVLWRTEVFTRDNYTCIWCGARSGNGKAIVLNADHIKAFAVILKEYKIINMAEAESCKELWDIDNGRTLCRDCHQTTDTWGRPKLIKRGAGVII